VRLRVAGEDREIERARFGRHFELIDILYDSAREEFDKVIAYVALATETPGDQFYEDEIADNFNALTTLNEPTQMPAIIRFQPQSKNGAKIPPGFDYRGRWLASAVNDLAHHYGWTVEYILDLGPEEALLYLQEITAQLHSDREFEYNLSDAGRDKRGKQKAFPKLAWAQVPYTRETAGLPPVPEIMRPIGNIIRVDDLVRKQSA
jgi:hypothetical protein